LSVGAGEVLTSGFYASVMEPSRRRHAHPGDPAEARDNGSVALHLARAGWLLVGVALLSSAHWPSSCMPHGWLDAIGAYGCSLRLTEQRGWMEAALLTWLWATPILASMALLRWVRR